MERPAASLKEFTKQYRLANVHRPGGIKCMPLLRVDEKFMEAIEQEVRNLLSESRASVVTDERHGTYWTNPYGDVKQLSLFNTSGNPSDYSDDFRIDIKKTFYPGAPHLGQLFKYFEGCEVLNFRINLLGGGESESGLSWHEEAPIWQGWVTGERFHRIPVVTKRILFPFLKTKYQIRFHLPVITNEATLIGLDGEIFHFQPGTIYLFNNGCVHYAANKGSSDRVHLVWDVFLSHTLWEKLLRQPGKEVEDSSGGLLKELSPKEKTITPVLQEGMPSTWHKLHGLNYFLRNHVLGNLSRRR